MKCLLRYPGGKSRMLPNLAPYLAGMLEGENNYGEPFAGGASVALYVARNFKDIFLHLNDKDPLIASLWKVISGPPENVIRLITLINVTPTLDMWHAVKESQPIDDVDRAFKAIFMNRTSWNGLIHTSRPIGGLKQYSAWPIHCRYNVTSLVKLIQEHHALLAGRTKVTCLDATQFLRQNPHPCFVDPPYLMKGKNALYGVTMTETEHADFAEVLRSLKKWVLTYDMKDKIACDLYWGSSKNLIDTRYSMDTGHRAHRKIVHIAEWKKASEICAWKGFHPKITA